MERLEEILMACVEFEPIGTVVGCLVLALPAGWCKNNICKDLKYACFEGI